MAKLKFDRSINMSMRRSEYATVPADEVWKIVALPPSQFRMNGETCGASTDKISPFAYILGGC